MDAVGSVHTVNSSHAYS